MVKLLRTDHTSIPQGLDLLLELVTREERDYGVQQFRKIHGLPGYNVLKGNIIKKLQRDKISQQRKSKQVGDR